MSNQVATYNHYENKALAGFFSWLRRTVNRFINAISSLLPAPVHQILDDFTNGDGQFNPFNVFNAGGAVERFANPVDYPLTTSDEFMLDNWAANFMAYIKPVFERLRTVRNGQSTVAEIKQVFNDTQKLISVFRYYQNYTLNNGDEMYSQNAILSRNAFLDIQIGTLEETLNELISQYSITVKPRTETISIMESDYSRLDFTLPNVFATSVKRFAISAIDDVEITDEDNDTGIIDDIVVPPSQTSDKAKGGNIYKWAFAALLLLVLLKNKRKSIN